MSVSRALGTAPLFTAQAIRYTVAAAILMAMAKRARVPLVRPRDISEVKLDPKFHELHREIWQTLKAEVIKGYVQSEGA